MTYTNNDYGKGLADSIQTNFEAAGGKVTISAPHEDGKGDYSAEVGALASAGGEVLIVAGYLDQGGKGIIQASLDSYDGAALILLAMQAAGSMDPAAYKEKIEMVANAPGTEIFPGELGKALELIAAGEDIDYVGASAVELVNGGESAGNYREIQVEGGENTTANFR